MLKRFTSRLSYLLVTSMLFMTIFSIQQVCAQDTLVYGDVDKSGNVDIADLLMVKKFVLKKISVFPNKDGAKAADVDGDGDVTGIDYLLMKQFIMGKINKFPADNNNNGDNGQEASSGGYSTATGSTDAPVTVTNLSQLKSAFNSGKHHIVVSGNIYGGSELTTLTFATKDWDNVTIEGEAGGKAVLQNIQLKFSGERLPLGTYINNIIIKNITFYGNISDLQKLSGSNTQPGGSGTNYLGISFRRVTNATVDHCAIYNTSDDLMCISLASDDITVSYCHFYFTSSWLNMNPNPIWNWVGTNQDLASERLAMVIGKDYTDSYTYGGERLHVTMHHNWFGPNIKGRPLMRGFVHLYNNYFDNGSAPSGKNAAGYWQQQYNANQIGSGSVVYSENNYFYKTNQSNQIGLDKPDQAYSFYEMNNIYNSTTGKSAVGAAFPSKLPFQSKYNYKPDSARDVPDVVQKNAGPK